MISIDYPGEDRGCHSIMLEIILNVNVGQYKHLLGNTLPLLFSVEVWEEICV